VLGPGKYDARLVIALGAGDGFRVLVEPCLEPVWSSLTSSPLAAVTVPKQLAREPAAPGKVPASPSASGSSTCARFHTGLATSWCWLGWAIPEAIHLNINSSPALASSDGHAGIALGRTVRRLTASSLRRIFGRSELNSFSLSQVQVPEYMANVSSHSGVGSACLTGTAAATSGGSRSNRNGCTGGANHSRHRSTRALSTLIPSTSAKAIQWSLPTLPQADNLVMPKTRPAAAPHLPTSSLLSAAPRMCSRIASRRKFGFHIHADDADRARCLGLVSRRMG